MHHNLVHEQWNLYRPSRRIYVAPYWGEYCENTDTACDVNHPCPHGGDCDALTNTCECTTPYTETVSIALKAALQIQCQAIV